MKMKSRKFVGLNSPAAFPTNAAASSGENLVGLGVRLLCPNAYDAPGTSQVDVP